MPQTLPNPQAHGREATRVPEAGRRFDAPGALGFWHLASLDAPTVAVVWSVAFAWAAGVRLPRWIPVLLALVTWTVYVADRLLDTRAALRAGNLLGLRERHLFHYCHRTLLVPLAVAAACGAGCIVFTLMPSPTRVRDSLLGAAALAYFTGVHSSRGISFRALSSNLPVLRKELLVGLLFTSACALPVFSRAATQGRLAVWPLSAVAVFFMLLAWLNCHAIDRWESKRSANEFRTSTPACILAIAGWLVTCSLQPRPAALVIAGATSALLLALLDRFRGRLTPLALRAAADLVLLTPLALLVR
ncbi:MAG: hypothetical protein ACLPY1_01600 [Terracidiphilus sp.]